MTAVNLSFPREEEKFSLSQLGRIVSRGAAARCKPNVPENSPQQPGSPWLLRDECSATRPLGAEANMEVANSQEEG
jgi:hypothetical protein